MLSVEAVWSDEEQMANLLKEWEERLSQDVGIRKKAERLEIAVANLEVKRLRLRMLLILTRNRGHCAALLWVVEAQWWGSAACTVLTCSISGAAGSTGGDPHEVPQAAEGS